MAFADDRRGASEMVGTVFVIGLTIAVAVMVVALAGGAIQAIGEETEDSLTNDAFYQMDGQINQLATSQIDAATELGFPEDTSVEPMPNEGNVTVNVSVSDPDHGSHVVADEPSNSTNFTVGTIKYEDRHGQTLVYQGGGLWQYASEDHVNLRSNPPFDYDGQRINFQFVNVSDITTVNEGEKVTVSKSAEDSSAFSKRIRDNLSAQWTIDEGSGFTVPVDVNVTIESKFALAWKIYAEEGLQEQPDKVVYHPNEGNPDKQANVTMTFNGIGGSDLPEYPGPILYAGSAAQASNIYDPFGNATIRDGANENEIEIAHNTGPHQQHQQLAFYDSTEDEWMIHWRNDGNRPPQNNNEWYNVSETINGFGEPTYSDDTVPPQIDDFDSDSSSESHTYEFNDAYAGMQICVVAYEDTEQITGNTAGSSDGVIDHLEQCAANLDVSDPGEYMPTDMEVNISTDVSEGVLGESKNLEIHVNNTGAIESQVGHDVALYHEIDGELVLADYATSSDIGPIDAGDNATIDMTWTPRDTSTDAIHAVVGSHDADRRNVSVEGRNIDLDVEVTDETPDTVAFGERLTVNASINNTGNVGLSGTNVVLREEDGTPVDRTQITLDSGNETNVSLDWQAPIRDFDEELEVQVIGSSDTHRVSPSGRANFDVEIDDVDDAAHSGFPMSVSATVENTGNANGTQEILLFADTEQVDSLITDSVEVGPLPPGETREVDLEWDSPVDPVSGDNNVIVRSRDDSDTESFDVAPRYEVTIDSVSPENVSEDSLSETVTVETTVTNRGDVEGDQEITLDVPESSDLRLSDVDSVQKHISGGTSESVTLEATIESDAITGNLSVSSEDDRERSRVIIKRDGPDCWDRHVTYEGTGSNDDPYQISTVDELQCMDEHMWQGDDVGAQYVLTDDIDAHGTKHWYGGQGFVPIGDQRLDGRHFEGDFDGNGHKIEGLTINRPNESFIGLFATTDHFEWESEVGEGVTIENIKLEDIDVHGKTVVGGLVGGAGGSIERVSVSGYVKSEYQQVGGIVGNAHDADLDNELVSHATVEGGYPAGVDDEHPWQYNNLGIGGIVGGTGFKTDIATAYSTANVTGNSAVGGITGWTSDYDSTNEQMYWAGGHVQLDGERRLDEIDREDLDDNPTAGAIAGRMELDEDNFQNSVYSDENYPSIGEQKADADDIPLAPEDMKGPKVLPDSEADNYPGITEADTEGTMENLSWDIWEPVYEINETGAIVNESYPVFEWEVEGAFVVEDIEAPDTVTEGETVTIDATITSTKDEHEWQDIRLFDPNGNPIAVDTRQLGPEGTATVTFEWDTQIGDNTSHLDDPKITVRTEDAGNTRAINVTAQETSQFMLSNVTAPDEANATEQVNVSAHVVNTGGSGDQTIFLEHEDGRVLDSRTVELDKEESADVNLSWFSQIDDNGDDQTLTIKSLDNEISTTVDMDDASVPDFTIGDVTFPDFDPNETPVVTAGDPITAEVTIENEGGAPSTELVWMTPAGAPEILDHNETTLDPGEEVTFNLTWNATSPDVDVLEVHVEGEDPITKQIHVQDALDGAVADPIDVDLTLINRAD